jgi:lipopolysaccharide heptosyltransferase II
MGNIFRNNIKKIKIFSLKTVAGIADVLHLTRKFVSDTPKNCLIINTAGIGDTIWSTPAIRALKTHFPGLNISVLAKAGGAEILKGNPFIDSIFVFAKGALNILSLFKALRNSHFGTVIVFHATDRIVWLMAYLTGGSKIVGSKRHSKETDFVITHPVDIPHNTHAIYARQLLIKELSIKSNLNKIELFITDDERKRTDSLLEELGINKDSLIIGFHPGAAKPYKRWPERNFIELGKMLSKTMDDVHIIITGNSKEKELSQNIADDGGGISLAGRLSLRETSAAIGRCNLFITNDTGPMHIAVALGVPTIALFSATGIENVEPYRSLNTFTIITKPKPCKECISKECTEPICMEQISPEEVFEVVKEQIWQKGN